MSTHDPCQGAQRLLNLNLQENKDLLSFTVVFHCCTQPLYQIYYALLVKEICKKDETYLEIFKDSIKKHYRDINKWKKSNIVNFGMLFGDLMCMNVLGRWEMLSLIGQDKGSSVFIKTLKEKLYMEFGLQTVREKLREIGIEVEDY
ncbi:pre-mRNA-splicing factor CWC22-like [Henckelia pumila]|uniref:pre-mRNA-splicing factor CWC22-like n=1 Tax=Henckelia pumila TaxID=405737 RepID=UPI003C6E7E99